CALRSEVAGRRRRRRTLARRGRVVRRAGGAHRRRSRQARDLSARPALSLLALAEQQQFRHLGARPRRHPVRFALEGDRPKVAKLSIRDATRADARAIAEIHVAAWRAAYRGLIPDDYLASLSVEKRTGFWETIIGRAGPAKLALADLDGEMAGFCLFGPTRDEAPSDIAEIYSLNIHPDRWRLGAGRL